jgi:hypothetical protein
MLPAELRVTRTLENVSGRVTIGDAHWVCPALQQCGGRPRSPEILSHLYLALPTIPHISPRSTARPPVVIFLSTSPTCRYVQVSIGLD